MAAAHRKIAKIESCFDCASVGSAQRWKVDLFVARVGVFRVTDVSGLRFSPKHFTLRVGYEYLSLRWGAGSVVLRLQDTEVFVSFLVDSVIVLRGHDFDFS